MKTEIKVKKTVEIKWLHVEAGVRYWEDATVNGVEDEDGSLIPWRDGDYWKPRINIDTGEIVGWPTGVKANIHYKVCDNGTYYLKDPEGNILLKEEGYVPKIMCPEENGYGDYIIMSVDENGFIRGWKPDISDFINEDED